MERAAAQLAGGLASKGARRSHAHTLHTHTHTAGYDLAVRVSGVREEAALEEQLAEGKVQAPSAALASSGAGAMPAAAPARARASSPAASANAAGKAAASTSVKKRRDTGLQGEYWNTLSPRTRR